MDKKLLEKAQHEKQELKDRIKNYESEHEMAHLKGLEILVIDDDINFINLIETHLKKLGVKNIQCASTEIEAISNLTKGIPDLIILDVMLPSINGFSMAKIAREVCKLPVPILYVTANRNFKQEFKILEDLQNTDHIFKPIDKNLLAQKIRELISHYRR